MPATASTSARTPTTTAPKSSSPRIPSSPLHDIDEINDDQTDILRVIERVWGYHTLRPLQSRAIRAGVAHRDSLVVMPTGGGKSLCYQVPPLLVDGRMDIVVSPLISLMKDQVDSLQANGYPAAAINSNLSMEERRAIAGQIRRGELRLLFIAPERLMSNTFLNFLESSTTSIRAFAIDEAHCISQWGHDFRPEYRQLDRLRQRFPDASVHAYTATATPQVRDDIITQLHLRDPEVLVGNFDRPNLCYRILPRMDVNAQVLEVIRQHEKEAVIIYCISRKDTEKLAAFLKAMKISAAHYHAGMYSEERRRVQEAFAKEQLDVIVATVAFGMGIDRSNVRCVIHTAMPKTIEAYQQETGRAGRDGLNADCVMFYRQSDCLRWERMMKESADKGEVSPDVYQAMLALLHDMRKFASGVTCRHKALVEYFGQSYAHADCKACDVCLNELDTVPDATTIAQKIISCVLRLKRGFGVNHIVDVLVGANTDLIRRYRHHELSVYGLMKGTHKKRLAHFTRQLIDQDLLAKTNDDYSVVIATDKSVEVLRGERTVRLVDAPPPSAGGRSSRHGSQDDPEWEGVDRELFEKLRELRAALAVERNVAASVILSDRVLREMARRRPSSMAGMKVIRGIGERKLEDFGQQFVSVVMSYCQATGAVMDITVSDEDEDDAANDDAGAAPYAPSGSAAAAFPYFRKGDSVESVSRSMGRAVSTVSGYLEQFIEFEKPASIDPWVSTCDYEMVVKVLNVQGIEGRLKPIFEDLKGKVSYEAIRFVRAHRRNEKARLEAARGEH